MNGGITAVQFVLDEPGSLHTKFIFTVPALLVEIGLLDDFQQSRMRTFRIIIVKAVFLHNRYYKAGMAGKN